MRQWVSSSAMRVVLVITGVLTLALACHDPTDPHVLVGAVPLTAPARFAMWWRMTQTCSGLTGDYASVQWYYVPNTTTLFYQNREVDAYWISDPDRIVLADARKNDGMIVRHEMLHALLHRSGHPRDAYLVGCGGVVACDGGCALEAGSYESPPEDAPVLQPRDVSPRVDLFAPLPAEVTTVGAVAAMVTITNPRSVPVWVKLTPRESGDFQYPTFGLTADFDDPTRIAAQGLAWSQGDRLPLGVGENKRWVWEATLSPGRYGVLGYFNSDSLPRSVISIGQ